MIRCIRRGESGLASAQSAVGLAIAIVILMFAANIVAMHYTRGALRSAVSAGARAGALAGGTIEACESRAELVLRGESRLLRGPYGSDARVLCVRLGGTIEAIGTVTGSWWIDEFPAVRLRVTAEATIESVTQPDLAGLQPSSG